MCNYGCKETFYETGVRIYNTEDQWILTGMRNLQNCLWDIQVDLLPAVVTVIQHANGIVRKKMTKTDLVWHHHLLLGNPTSNSLLKVIMQGFLDTLPGIDEKLVTKHLPPNIDTYKGNLKQDRQGMQPTKL